MKEIVLMRGLPGSGKSYSAKTHGDVVRSTDDFFVGADGVYRFDPARLAEAHAWNQARVAEDIKAGVEQVVVDNTNTCLWEMTPYVRLARAAGYSVGFGFPATKWADDPEECFKRNTHGVPLETIQRMAERYEPLPFDGTIEAIMAAKPPWEK